MAEARISVDQNEFMCPECLDLLKDPAGIPSGHGYCKSCITGCCDQDDQKRIYSCPQCRQTFSPSSALAKNTKLAEVMEKEKKSELSDCCIECGDVQHDQAIKSRLMCRGSYCQTHLEQPENFSKGKRYNLTDTTGRLQEMICQKHFCRTDLKCICVLCKHKNHETVSSATQRTEKQSFTSLSSFPGSTDIPIDPCNAFFPLDGLRESVCQLRDKLEGFCIEELRKISDRVTFTNIVPWTRNDFLQYYLQLTLDLNTVNESLHLSVKNSVITYTEIEQPYPDHPDRFDYWEQVLCRESVCGRCYWEIEWSGVVFVSVSYKSIERKELDDDCLFGGNDQSWSLFCSSSRCSFYHNRIERVLPVVPRCCKIGVYVDHSAGILSFYSLSDTMSLIHSVQTTFTQPIYPGFRVCYGSSVKLC